ncbi:MAG TPA: cation-translocating P-type ATPase, partial [Noviherbaspirillum sp.]
AERLPAYPQSRRSETVAAARLAEGDAILVRPGEAIPADGILLESEAAIDVSLLTGESEPQRKAIGDMLPGGAVNLWQPLVLRVVNPVADSTLAALVRLAERAGQAKPRIAEWADRVAAWFVACLLVFALITFAYWRIADPERAWPIAIAVLVVSCPCALSLATPTALAAATNALMRRGVLVLRPHVLETLHRATHVVFDKTGTLTVGKPGVTRIVTECTEDEGRCLRMAFALEASSAHPLGTAIANEARRRGMHAEPAVDAHHTAGQGVAGTVDGIHYRIGSMTFVGALCGVACPWEEDGASTSIYLGTAGRWLARFDIADALRDEARETVARFLAAGKTVMLLSGDRPEAVRRIADSLGIEHAQGACLPEQKLAFVQDLQRQGAIVAMAGDGINDAAVLRAADVSFAMGSGAALAQAQADAVLLSGRIDAMQEAAATAAKAMAVIRQNLAWAVFYNALAIPAAAFGWLSPWMSAVGMSFSSAAVVVNALRLAESRHLTERQSGQVRKSFLIRQ